MLAEYKPLSCTHCMEETSFSSMAGEALLLECKGGSRVGQGSEEILSREGVRGWRDN